MPNYDFDPANYENKEGGGSNLLPAGKHIVRVIDHELGESSSGLAQVVVDFQASDGRSRKAWLIAEGKAGFQFASLLNACGWTSKINLAQSGMIKRAIYGKDVEIVVAEDTYQGKTSLKVKWINKAPERAQSGGAGRVREEPPPRDDDPEIPF